MEIWKDVVGYEGFYEVSNTGKVRSATRLVNHPRGQRLKKGRIMKAHNSAGTYQRLMLSKFGIKEKVHIHRLVAIAFLEKIEGKDVVNHIDANPANNNVENLEWCTQRENAEHAAKNGLYNSPLGEDSGRSVLTEKQVIEIRNTVAEGRISGPKIAKLYGVERKTINLIVRGINWKHVGGPRTFKRGKNE